MLRPWLVQLAVVPMLLLILVGCTGSNGETLQDVQSDSTGDTNITCPDGLVLWPGYDVCAPQVDECEAWEVPVIGGGCMAVGPRACPKLWDPDADVDCEPGELMDYDGEPCPPGFVLTEDEVACIPFFEEDGVCGELEIPVLGGGCQRVGPEWAVPGQPLFDECGDGLIALPGGGCVMIGPRGCPKVWDPDADVDCEVGDVLPCPEGWIESEDGMYCHPGWDECPHGDVPLTGGGCERLLPLAADCPAGPFPQVPEGVTDVQYVLADSPCSEGCGTEAAPYPSIQVAIDAAPAGAAVLVGPGTYAEGLTLDEPVQVQGLCPAMVEITGTGLVLPDGDSKVLEAGVGIYDVQGAAVRGVRVRSPAVGIAVVGATEVVIESVEITESQGVALYVDGGSELEAEVLWIHDTGTGSGQMGHGRGMWVGGGAELEAHSVLVEDARKTGIEVREEGSRLDLTDGVIRTTNPGSSGEQSRGIRAAEGCAVTVVDSLLEENSEVGLAAWDSGTNVMLSSSVIRKTIMDENREFGQGIQAQEGCKVSVTGSLLEENGGVGLAVFSSGTEVEVSGSVIRETQPDENWLDGVGIAAIDGCRVSVSGTLLEENRVVGLAVFNSGTEVEVSGSVIRKTMPDENGEGGRGIQASNGCKVSVTGSLLEENRTHGLYVAHSGTEIQISGSVVRTTLPNEIGEICVGIRAFHGSAVSVADSLLGENGAASIWLDQSGTKVEVSGSVIRKTMPDKDGGGILAHGGGTVSVIGSLLEDNRGVSLGAWDSGTEVEVSSSVIRNPMSIEYGVGGWGILASDDSTVSVTGSLLEDIRTIGIGVWNSGTEVEIFSSVIRNPMSVEYGVGGSGIQAWDGCRVSVTDSLLEDNRLSGFIASDSGTEVEMSGSVIRTTLNENEELGTGVLAKNGSRVSLAGSLMEENRIVGLAVTDSGTEVEVSGSVIRKTMPDENVEASRGIQAGNGCTVSVSGSLLEENRVLGLGVWNSGTKVDVSGSVIRKTLPDNEGMAGMGLIAQDGASGTASWCRIEGNNTAGILAYSQSEGSGPVLPSVLHVENSAVLKTEEGGDDLADGSYEVFGDGVVAVDHAELHLESVVVMDNARAGAYYHESAGGMSNTVIASNGSYGLAMQSCHQYVDDSNTFIFGNVTEAVTSSPHGLPVPPSPGALEVFSPDR